MWRYHRAVYLVSRTFRLLASVGGQHWKALTSRTLLSETPSSQRRRGPPRTIRIENRSFCCALTLWSLRGTISAEVMRYPKEGFIHALALRQKVIVSCETTAPWWRDTSRPWHLFTADDGGVNFMEHSCYKFFLSFALGMAWLRTGQSHLTNGVIYRQKSELSGNLSFE